MIFLVCLVVISAKSEAVMLRRPLEVGLYFLIAILFPSFSMLDYYASKNSISLLSAVNLTIALRRLFV